MIARPDPISTIDMTEKLLRLNPLNFYKRLCLISKAEMLEIRMPGLILFKGMDANIFSALTPPVASILRDWAKQGMDGFIFYKNLYLLQIATPIPGSRLSSPVRMSVDECVEKWRGHLLRAEGLRATR